MTGREMTGPEKIGQGLELEDGDAGLLAIQGGRRITRGELKRRADALAAELKSRGVARALVQSDDPVDILRAIDGCDRVGTDLFVAHTNIPEAFVEELSATFGVGLTVGAVDVPRSAAPGEPPAGRVHMMTSGTTGRPKVAAHTLSSLLNRVRAGAQLPANRDGRWLLTYQPTGFAGVQVLLTAVLSRGVIVAPEERTPAGFHRAALESGVTQISATPTFWRAFLMVTKPGELALKQITLGGEAVDQATLDRLRSAFPDARITHIYASTEAGVVFAVHDGREGFPAAWLEQPAAGARGAALRIRDGFLQIKTANAMSGYVTEAAQPILEDGWLATADLCELRDDRVIMLGRQDSTINVGGSKVYPLAVETVLLADPGVAEARVYGAANPVTGQLVAADLVLAAGQDPHAARTRIAAMCRERLAGYQIPRLLKFVDAIEVRESGKKG
jgi:acyl-coenzyme A synthetase/AMP-(fatty) acid ligase